MDRIRKPEWLNKKLDYESMREIGNMLRELNLHSVCEGARCPNMGECFRNRTATFMILGNTCTRNCRFCAIPSGKVSAVDINEPKNLAIAAKKLNLKHVVVTSVTRDDLEDGGARQFAAVIHELRNSIPNVSVEVLTPDFNGNHHALDTVIEAKPEIFNHNVETIPSLYYEVRPMASYRQSLEVIEYVKTRAPQIITKSGLMLGLGETEEQVKEVINELHNHKCDMLTIGQYLPPSFNHALLKEYVHPEVFESYKKYALSLGFRYVASGPYVRSSYHAAESLTQL